jgi:dihydroxyacetone kinase-like protein
MVTRDQIVSWLQEIAAKIDENKEYLTELDAEIGDADHGTNMDRGFRKVMSQLPGMAESDIGSILKTTGMALISSVGGAGGPLYGTFFMRAGMATDSRNELDDEELAGMFTSALEGVIQRGKAKPGDKTMVDALGPAVEAFSQYVEQGGNDTVQGLRRAMEAAEQGMKDTIPLVARKGRASYLGERSAGHQDPGATSSHMIVKALYEVVSTSSG